MEVKEPASIIILVAFILTPSLCIDKIFHLGITNLIQSKAYNILSEGYPGIRKILVVLTLVSIIFLDYYQYKRAKKIYEKRMIIHHKKIVKSIDDALKCLDNDNLKIRCNAINKLQKISDYSDEYYWNIAEIMCAFIRQGAVAKRYNEENFLVDLNEAFYIFNVRKGRRLPNGRQLNLSNVYLPGITIYSDYENTLKRVDLSQVILNNSKLNCSNLIGVNLREASLVNATLMDVNLSFADLSGADFHKANLFQANLKGARLPYTNLKQTNLEQANLERADLSSSSLYKVNLKGANLRGANLSLIYMLEVNLEGADLSGANLKGAKLSQTNLEGANLKWANLKGAELFQTNLEGANLGEANLEGADLGGANLEGVNLEGANLEGANLEANWWT